MRLSNAARDCSSSSACRDTYGYFSCSKERGEHFVIPLPIFSSIHSRKEKTESKKALYIIYKYVFLYIGKS